MKKRLAVMLFALFALSMIGLAREIIVDSTADSGQGTLRWALQTARSGDVITFDLVVFPPENPATIRVRTELPFILQGNLTIDGSNAGVILDGCDCSSGCVVGLEIHSNHNTVQGLQIVNFPDVGIILSGGAMYNVIGGDRQIGEGPIGQGNVISGNCRGIGIWDEGVSYNTVMGNLIGPDITGNVALGKQDVGIEITRGAHHNTIGPNNIIAFNSGKGVEIGGDSTFGNTIKHNSIHSNAGVGICLARNGNHQIDIPTISRFDLSLGTVRGKACPGCIVEIYSDELFEGKHYEGHCQANESGAFEFATTAGLRGPSLTATATDPDGNTSAFSDATFGPGNAAQILQMGKSAPITQVEPSPSTALQDNRIGSLWDFPDCSVEGADEFIRFVDGLGLKRARIILELGDWVNVDWKRGYSSRPHLSLGQERIVSGLFDLGVKTMCCLVFWDIESPGQDLGDPGYSRFKSEEEISRYLDYVATIAAGVRERVPYFEILNEPNHWEGTQQYVQLSDYIRLVKRVIPVIRAAVPGAKIVVGATAMVQSYGRDYLLELLRSDLMPLIDGISFHPMYGVSPEYYEFRSYYYNYARFLEEIKSIAGQNGFDGELIADELTWRTYINPHPLGAEAWEYSPISAAKYYARGTLMHLGADVVASFGGERFQDILPIRRAVRTLCTVMASHEAISMPVEINVEHNGPLAYCTFRYTNGDRMLAVRTDGAAQDEDHGVPATIKFPELVAGGVTGIDVLHGFKQELVFEIDGRDTVVRDLLVKDYPILIRLSDVKFGPNYEETVGDGFHRIGDIDAVTDGQSNDRDSDGVPDDKDLCPDWPGNAETGGC